MSIVLLANGRGAVTVDDEDEELVGGYSWCLNGEYAIAHGPTVEGKRRSVLMHRLILGVTDPKIHVDHIDGQGLNNRRSNLRLATRSQNMCNRRKNAKRSSKYLGVTWHSNRSKWQAHIKIDKRHIHLGLFTNEIEAAIARDAWVRLRSDEFRTYNFPLPGERSAISVDNIDNASPGSSSCASREVGLRGPR